MAVKSTHKTELSLWALQALPLVTVVLGRVQELSRLSGTQVLTKYKLLFLLLLSSSSSSGILISWSLFSH